MRRAMLVTDAIGRVEFGYWLGKLEIGNPIPFLWIVIIGEVILFVDPTTPSSL